MSVAFWSAKLSGGKPVEVQPPEGYVLNVQQAAITGEGHAVIKVKTVSVEGDNIEAVIATLRAKTTDQVNLSLVFGYDVPVSFVAEGKADVYLSGYYQPGPEEDGDDEDDENDYDSYDSEEDDEEGSEDDDEEANIRNAEAAIAKLGAARKALKDAPAEDSEDDSEDDDSEEDSEDDSEEEKIDSAFVAKMVAKHGLDGKAPKSSRVEELGSEDESEDESEEESEEEEAPPVKVQKTQAKGVVTPSGQKPKPTTPAHNNNNNKPKTPNGGNNNNNNKTPNNQGGNKNNNNSAHKSGDKRKR